MPNDEIILSSNEVEGIGTIELKIEIRDRQIKAMTARDSSGKNYDVSFHLSEHKGEGKKEGQKKVCCCKPHPSGTGMICDNGPCGPHN